VKSIDELEHGMVKLTSLLHSSDFTHSSKPKGPWWQLGPFGKANLSIVFLIAAGLGAFVLVRDDVMSRRKQQMKLRKGVEERIRKEVEEAGKV